MEITTTSSPPKNTEFEFQMPFSCSDDKKTPENKTSPADELFYRGKLLPLHHPPRQQPAEGLAVEISDMPSQRSKSPLPESCFRRPSSDGILRQDCDFFEFPGELGRFTDNLRPAKKPPSDSLKLVKRSPIAYLKSLFAKSACDFSWGGRKLSKGEALLSKFFKIPKRARFSGGTDYSGGRKSFSGAVRRHSPTKCFSSSSSNSASSSCSSFSLRSNGQVELGSSFRMSNCADEIEASIDAAIAHCKRSLQIYEAADLSGADEDGKGTVSL
ncbi:Probable membrane-associated kinase regulator 3 [Striga hermonthica]|uniref:Probable membrane-associated kinase regulator 3 n=1 Tax=Striga hermonthica TaxID=68872 RepID=A0A9N7NFI5_STRHE|nr:Probable membrane-associated kinase regulator 3 [Striga hermonthica]